MAKLCSLLALVCVLGFGGCGRIHVKSEYDKNTDFSRYQTFSFIPMRPSEETTQAFSVINQERINRAITRELEFRNYRRVEGEADLKVSNYLTVDSKHKTTTRGLQDAPRYGGDYYGPGYYSYSRGGYDTVEYRKGTLIIDLVDTKDNKVIWHGIGTGTAMEKAKDPEAKINEAVEKMFLKYPVKVKDSVVSK